MLFEETIGRMANPSQSSIWKLLSLIIRIYATSLPSAGFVTQRPRLLRTRTAVFLGLFCTNRTF